MANPQEQVAPPAYAETCPAVADLDLTVLYEPINKSDIVADLVFVHGLGDHPEHTWSKWSSSQGEDEGDGAPKPKKAKLGKKSKRDAQSESARFWP